MQRGRPLLVEFWDFCRPLAAHAALREGLARALPAAGLRVVGVHCPGFEPSRDEEAVGEAVARLGIEHPVLIDTSSSSGRSTSNGGWPARYLFDGGRGCSSTTTARAPTTRPSWRSRSCSGSSASRGAGAPRGRSRARLSPRRRSPGAYAGRTRREACGPSSGARARCVATTRRGESSVDRIPAPTPDRARPPHGRELELEAGAGVPARPRASRRARLTRTSRAAQLARACGPRASRRTQLRRALVLDQHAGGPVGALAGRRRRGRSSIRPAAGVDQPRARASAPRRARRRRQRPRAVGVAEDDGASPSPRRAATSPIARRPARAQLVGGDSARSGPRPARFSAATASGKPARARACAAARPARPRRARRGASRRAGRRRAVAAPPSARQASRWRSR